MPPLDDPDFSDTVKRHITELAAKKKELSQIKKDIKNNPDTRYLKRKELGGEVKELEALICDEMDEGDEVVVGRRRFKKLRTESTKYTKDRVHDFCQSKSIDPETYDEENKEEKIALKAIGKQK